MLTELISQWKSIFRHLDNKTQLMPDLPLKNFLLRSNLRLRSLDYSVEKFGKHLDEILNIIFDKEKKRDIDYSTSGQIMRP